MVTRVIASSSAGPEYLKGIRCLIISEKYSLASLDVLVPKPGGADRKLHEIFANDHVYMHVLEPLSNVIANTQCAGEPICAPFTFYITWTHKEDRVKTLLTFASVLPQVFQTNLCSIWSSRIWCYFVSPSTHWTLGYCRKQAPASYWMPRERQHQQSLKRFHNKHFCILLMTRAAGIYLDDRCDKLF